jgi:hypothetical protein
MENFPIKFHLVYRDWLQYHTSAKFSILGKKEFKIPIKSRNRRRTTPCNPVELAEDNVRVLSSFY